MNMTNKMKFQIAVDILTTIIIMFFLINLDKGRETSFIIAVLSFTVVGSSIAFKPKNLEYFKQLPKSIKTMRNISLIIVAIASILIVNVIINKSQVGYPIFVYGLFAVAFILLVPVKLHYYRNYKEM